MNYTDKEVLQIDQISITNHLPDLGIEVVRKEIIDGLSFDNKHISSKFFYDEAGSRLFGEITRLEEYYPTRTEIAILKQIALNLMEQVKDVDLVELGSGDCSKISILFDAVPEENMSSIHYLPVDVSQSAMENAANQLINQYPNLTVSCQVADFARQLDKIPHNAQRLFCFFGSTIGNFEWKEANSFLKELSSNMYPGDQLLIGFDMVKDINVLHRAYNDSKGVTAAFNLNILNSIGQIIQADIPTELFEHKALYNPDKSRIEMYLQAKEHVRFSSNSLPGELIINKGESIHTENSHKYSMEDIHTFANVAGLRVRDIYMDSRKWFSLAHFEKE